MVIRSPAVANTKEAPGCRDAAFATLFFLGFGMALFAVGLALINQDSCTGLCETVGLASLYAGGPISALFGVFTDSVVIAWPLDITLWVVLGFAVARWASAHHRSLWGSAALVLILSVTYGLVLSQFVELTVSNSS